MFIIQQRINSQSIGYTTLFREYDPKIARWKSLDPKLKDFPSASPFSAMGNNPIMNTDVLGDSAKCINTKSEGYAEDIAPGFSLNSKHLISTDEFNESIVTENINSFIDKWNNPKNRQYAPQVSKYLEKKNIRYGITPQIRDEDASSAGSTDLTIVVDLLKHKPRVSGSNYLELVVFHELVHLMSDSYHEFSAWSSTFAAGFINSSNIEKAFADYNTYDFRDIPTTFKTYLGTKKVKNNESGNIETYYFIKESTKQEFLKLMYNHGKKIIGKD